MCRAQGISLNTRGPPADIGGLTQERVKGRRRGWQRAKVHLGSAGARLGSEWAEAEHPRVQGGLG